MRKRWLFALTICLLALLTAGMVTAQTTTTSPFSCEEADTQSQNAIVISGSINNVFDASRGLTGNTYCRILVRDRTVVTSLAEIGSQEAIQRDVIQAVDLVGMLPAGEIWNEFRTPVRVCLRGEGDILFLAASDDLGRQLTRLSAGTQAQPIAEATETPDAVAQPGYSCANVSSAGTVLLTPPGPPLPGARGAGAGNAPVPPADPASVVELVNCQVTTSVNALNLRREPSTNARIRWTFTSGQRLEATGIAGAWYRVNFRGTPGWISAAHVEPSGDCQQGDRATSDPLAPADPAATIELDNCEVVTSVSGLQLRREPSVLARIRWTFERDQRLKATGVAGNWYRIDFRGTPGWLNAQYLELSGDCTP